MVMRLYVDSQFISPYAMSAFVSLIEKGLNFEIETVDLAARAHYSASYATTSITRRVPTLVHEDFALSESSAISEYLDEGFVGNRLYPAELKNRSRARQVQAWLRSDLVPLRDERPSVVVFQGARKSSLSNAARASVDLLFSAVDGLLKVGAENLFSDWSVADVDLAMMLNRLIMHGDPVPDRLVTYAAHQWHRPSVRAWLAKNDRYRVK
jgi:glutathione S-transferase